MSAAPRARSLPKGPHALIVARFADPTLAMSTYDDLIDAEVAGFLEVDGVLVVKADEGASSTSRR